MTGKAVLANTGTLTAVFKIVEAFEKKVHLSNLNELQQHCRLPENVKDAASEPKLRRYDDTLELVPQLVAFSPPSSRKDFIYGLPPSEHKTRVQYMKIPKD
ncbi:hypothetical protein B0H14DRAFT_2601261 [Mycena olivaceomarginata]|nr:hypothetical protein B0H14DRAFT_2601261 [Mycena olivaceomarginata]